MELFLLLHAATTLAMGGLIWFVQLVHYPLFHAFREGDFPAFAAEHQRRTGWVVAPLMLVEATCAAMLVLRHPEPGLAWVGAVLLVLIWLSTFLVQVPCHHRLTQYYARDTVRLLIISNWVRTIGWTLRSIVALAMLAAHGT